ncbi:hypothetical protein BH18ACT15_BH18ACT15_03380 [soil metagenome]
MPSRELPAGIAQTGAVLAALLAILLWMSMLLAPWQLGSGLLDARSHLEEAQKALRQGATKTARYEALAGLAAAGRAKTGLATGGPLFDLVRIIPPAGDALHEAPHLVAAANQSAKAAKGTLRVIDNALRGPGRIITRDKGHSRIRIARIEQVGDTVAEVRVHVQRAARQLAAINLRNLPGRAAPGIRRGISQAEETDKLLADAATGLALLPGVLGADGPRRYLIGAQNSDELRGTGGALLQFALLEIRNGRPKLQRGGAASVYDVDKNREVINSVTLPRDAWYQKEIDDSRRFGNANWSPDWPLSATLTLAFGRASSPRFPAVDGVFAVDPLAIRELVPAAGTFHSPRAHVKVTKRGVVELLLYRAYGKFPKPQIRRAVLKDVVDGFYAHLFDPAHPTALPAGLAKALAEKHVQAWFKDPKEEAFARDKGWDGGISRRAGGDYLNVVEQNVGGNKLNYFEGMRSSMDVRLGGPDAEVSTTVEVTNDVFLPQPRWILGDQLLTALHRPMINVYVPQRATLAKASHDGPLLPAPAPAVWNGDSPPEHYERGKKVWSATLDIPPGESGSVTFDYRVPGVVTREEGRKTYRLVLQHQPKLHPQTQVVRIRLPAGAGGVRAKGFERKENVLTFKDKLERDTGLEVSWRA